MRRGGAGGGCAAAAPGAGLLGDRLGVEYRLGIQPRGSASASPVFASATRSSKVSPPTDDLLGLLVAAAVDHVVERLEARRAGASGFGRVERGEPRAHVLEPGLLRRHRLPLAARAVDVADRFERAAEVEAPRERRVLRRGPAAAAAARGARPRAAPGRSRSRTGRSGAGTPRCGSGRPSRCAARRSRRRTGPSPCTRSRGRSAPGGRPRRASRARPS